MTRVEKKVLADHLKEIRDTIEKHTKVPIKGMNDYTVNDVVMLRMGYEKILSEVKILDYIFIEEDQGDKNDKGIWENLHRLRVITYWFRKIMVATGFNPLWIIIYKIIR